MISLGINRDGRKVLEQGFSSNNKREMEETELEEGEACSYHDDDDNNKIDLDALSYIDDKIQNLLGHLKKDFEGVVSAESLGAKFGVYGSFLPAYRRSPVSTHSRSPPRVQNHIIPQSPNALLVEGGHHNSLAPANVSYSMKQGSASAGSASSYAHRPPPQIELCRQNKSTVSVQSLEECTPKSEVRDQKTLKVRIKVGSDNLSVKKTAELYSGLGLDGSPTSSPDESPLDSEGLSYRLSFNGFESPTRILQMMTSSPLYGGCFLSPLPDDLMYLREKPKQLKDISTQPPAKVKPENFVIVHPSFSVRDKKTVSGENSMKLLDKRGLSLQGKRDRKDGNVGFDFPIKETDIDAVSCEELVSKALKLPLLSDVHSNIRGSPQSSLKEKVNSNASKKEPFETVSVQASLSEKPNGKETSAGKIFHKKTAEVGNNMVTDSEIIGEGKGETADCTPNISTGCLTFRNASKIGLKESVNQGTDNSTSRDGGIILPSGKVQLCSGDEKRSKKIQADGISTGAIAMEINKDTAQVLKDRKYADPENNSCRSEVQKDLRKARGQYADFFGEMNEQEGDAMDSLDVPSGEILKTSDIVDKTSLAYDNTSRERTSSLETRKGLSSGAKRRGFSNSALASENGRSISEPAPIGIDGNDHWVCCDKCQKWRLFPPGSKSDNLPEKWDCSMMTWLPDMNCCSVSEEETNNFHAPPSGMTSANILSSDLPFNRKFISKARKTSKPSFQDSPNTLPSSIKKKQQSVKEKALKEAKEYSLMNGLDLQQQPKSSDTYLQTDQHKKKENITDCYSDGGHAKTPILKRRESDHEFPRTSKKSKTYNMKIKDNDQSAAQDQGIETYGLAACTAGKDGRSDSEFLASQNPKDEMEGIPSDYIDKSKFHIEALANVGSGHINKSGSGNKKRKGDNLKDPASSTQSSGKLIDDVEKSSRKRHRTSKSEGKESSGSKKNGKAEKKSKSMSQQKLNGKESLQKDLPCVNPVMAATSSSSKISGSLKVKSKSQEIKGSPVDSVSSSPFRIPNSDRLTSGCKVIGGNDSAQDAVKLATSSPRRCSAAEYEGSIDRSRAVRKDIIATGILHGSPDYCTIDMEDKSKGGLQQVNGNVCIDKLDLDNGYPPEAQASDRCVNGSAREVLDVNVSNSGKKDSPSLSKDRNQSLKSRSGKGKFKMSEIYDTSLDHTSVCEDREKDRKIKADEKCGSNADKFENSTTLHNKEPSLLKSEGRQEYDEKRSSKKFDVEKSDNLVPITAKEKSRHVPPTDGEKTEISNSIQSCQSIKASTSSGDARPDGLPREPRPKKKADSQNGTHISSKHPTSKGHRIKNQDAPSPLRRDSASQAASSAIKEATSLKHLADRFKSSGSTESTMMYFEAALKFLHGASLLESGKTENIKHADIVQSMQIYSSTAKLCQFCAHEFEKSKDMANAALAYKCVEVAYLRVIYSSHNTASRDRHELQTALQMVPPGESPSSSASDIDNLNNTANGDKAAQVRSGGSPQLAANLVIAAKNRPNFSRLLSFAQDVNSAMEASRKSRVAFTAANTNMGQADSNDGITSIKRALDFNFHDVDGLLRLVRLAKEAISR